MNMRKKIPKEVNFDYTTKNKNKSTEVKAFAC